MDGTSETQGLNLDAWVALLQAVPGLESARITRDEQRALLDLTRVAAHRSERIAAPITAFLVGLALAPLEPEVRAGKIRELAIRLDAGEGASSGA